MLPVKVEVILIEVTVVHACMGRHLRCQGANLDFDVCCAHNMTSIIVSNNVRAGETRSSRRGLSLQHTPAVKYVTIILDYWIELPRSLRWRCSGTRSAIFDGAESSLSCPQNHLRLVR